MAGLPESATFDAEVTQIETNEPVVGGLNGVSNRALKQLANRTRYLKDAIEALDAAALGLDQVPNYPATDSLTDGSSAKFATAAAASALKDLIDAFGATYLALAGGTLTGNLTLAKVSPILSLEDAGEHLRLALVGGVARLQIPTGQNLLIEGQNGLGGAAGITIETAGGDETVIHTGNLDAQFDVTGGAAGSWTLPGGIIAKWGGSASAGNGVNVTELFPIAFPVACDRVLISPVNPSGGIIENDTVQLRTRSAAGFDWRVTRGAGTPEGIASIDWIAIGR